MAQTVIVSPTSDPISLPQRHDRPALWRCLARRGMVFSELEGFDHVTVAPRGRLRLPARPYSELVVLIADGNGDVLLEEGRHTVGSGDLIIGPVGPGFTLVNTGDAPLDVVSVEIIPPRYADRLPYRTPMIVDLSETVAR